MSADGRDTLERLRRLNPALRLTDCADAAFAAYGRILPETETGGLVAFMQANAPIGEGTSYLRSVTGLEDIGCPARGSAAGETWKQRFSRTVFGGLPAQIGWVVGKNRRLNALEYHKSSEALVAGSDLVLLLGKLGDIEDYSRYDADKIEAFLVYEGQAIETWSTTLHFAPAMVSDAGFRAAIALPVETNAPLPGVDPGRGGEEGLLWATNKWLIACAGSGPAQRGAQAGISRNIEVII